MAARPRRGAHRATPGGHGRARWAFTDASTTGPLLAWGVFSVLVAALVLLLVGLPWPQVLALGVVGLALAAVLKVAASLMPPTPTPADDQDTDR